MSRFGFGLRITSFLFSTAVVSGYRISPANAQVPIDLEVQESACLMNQTLRATIGDAEDPDGIIFGDPLQVLELAGGHLLLLTTGGGPPRVFDSTGAFLRYVGGSGRGPGEFLRPSRALAVADDSLVVLDPGQSRAVVLSPAREGRTILGLPSIFEIDLLQWPRVVAVSDFQSTTEDPRTFHILDLSGARVSYAGGLRPASADRASWQPPEHWALHVVDSVRFWAVGGADYTLELWNTGGVRERFLRRDLPEYDSQNRSGIGNPHRPPPAYVVSTWLDTAGLLWVLLHVPRYDWRNAWDGVQISPNGEISLSQNENLTRDLYQTRIDIIDPRQNALIHSSLLPTFIVPLHHATGPRIAKYRLTGEFVPVIEIWELALDCSGGRDPKKESHSQRLLLQFQDSAAFEKPAAPTHHRGPILPGRTRPIRSGVRYFVTPVVIPNGGFIG
jgi:hypothetical protein